MGYANDIFLSVPLSILFYVLVGKITGSVFQIEPKKRIIIEIIIGLLLIVMGKMYYSKNMSMENETVKTALYGAGGLVIVGNMLIKWDKLDEIAKIITLGAVVCMIITYSYKQRYINL